MLHNALLSSTQNNIIIQIGFQKGRMQITASIIFQSILNKTDIEEISPVVFNRAELSICRFVSQINQ